MLKSAEGNYCRQCVNWIKYCKQTTLPCGFPQ